jgi:serine protease AprX
VSTVKADAARISFSALAEDIVWVVMDSGIDRDHPHFARHKNLGLDPALEHLAFTDTPGPFSDEFGHGTHVAGIIAGELKKEQEEIHAFSRHRDEKDRLSYNVEELDAISGMAPECKQVPCEPRRTARPGQAD